MSLQDLNALAAIGTFVVIAVTAGAALIQIRHLRVGYQLQSFLFIMERLNSMEMIEARTFCLVELPQKMNDAGFLENERSSSGDPRIALVGNFFSEIGTLVAAGTLDEQYYLTLLPLASRLWAVTKPVIELRRTRFGPYMWVEFEYLDYLKSTGLYDRKRLARLPPDFKKRYGANPSAPEA